MDEKYRIFWGESHDNTYTVDPPPAPIGEVIGRAASHLDFYSAAYYTSCAAAFRAGEHLSEGEAPTELTLEGWKEPERLEREWAQEQEATREMNDPGRFVTFPGYEWQGDGTSGDHNLIFRREGAPIFRVDTLTDLYERLRGRKVLAIPHHLAYRVGRRGHDWSVYDGALSPFAEIYSLHGCSETDEEWIGMRENVHMGPSAGAGTYEEALARGYHLGAICSTDNWGEMPGRYGHGRMACLAEELTRDSLWEAFNARRIYGVTGDRIRLDFRVNGARMGEVVPAGLARRIRVDVRGSDAIDRIEILRNNRVIATHCHQGTWDLPEPHRKTRLKLRIELGWGPQENEVPMPPKEWEGLLEVDDGRVLDAEPCWISPGQGMPRIDADGARFRMRTTRKTVTSEVQNAFVFELEGRPDSEIRLRINGREERGTVREFARRSRLMVFEDECERMLAERRDLEPGSPERRDIYHFLAYIAKIHRAIPESGYTARLEFDDDEPLDGESHYRVRVEQRNGQRAWSSPIWVRPGHMRNEEKRVGRRVNEVNEVNKVKQVTT